MFKNFSQVGLTSFALLGLFNLPILAQTTQGGSQEATVSGTNNQVYQTINQTIINYPNRGSFLRGQNSNKPNKGQEVSSERHEDNNNKKPRRRNRDDN